MKFALTSVVLMATAGWLGPASFRVARPTSAAPEIIIFHGGSLERPVVVASWTENHQLLLIDERRKSMPPRWRSDERPVIELALFWGREWRGYAESPAGLASLTPGRATQTGSYYPAVHGKRAIFQVGATYGEVSDSGLAVLQRRGIPTRVP